MRCVIVDSLIPLVTLIGQDMVIVQFAEIRYVISPWSVIVTLCTVRPADMTKRLFLRGLPVLALGQRFLLLADGGSARHLKMRLPEHQAPTAVRSGRLYSSTDGPASPALTRGL